ncbi:PorP/SprF family type IX secretion system membrane protein [Parvicella tangerina]|uniref:Type IX secretion system membrane protein PorP/SprF n=1 Tax=Parvicella tangerina TaxID=2829795 RepID=A0A916JPT1_9FLAO|nr:PorP/SprF family type IX secretion system membrane protein [Parvicella tangerina]CAG5085093.1 hypothetical protein CRYO30217_02648 [Parvicella tangerina]
MKSILPLILFLSILTETIAQQDIQTSNFDYFSSFYNPATITQTKHFCGNGIARNQWNGLNGRPNTGFLDASYNFSDLVWVNLSLTKDVIGFQDQSMIKLGIAKSLKVSPSVKLSFGVNVNYSSFRIAGSFITPDTPVWNDNSIPNSNISESSFDLDAGIFIKARNIIIGLSSTNLVEPTLSQPSFTFQEKRHYYVLGGYTIHHRIGDFENHLLAKSDVASTQIDLKSNLWSNQGWMVGLAYRISDAVIPMVGYQQHFGRVHIRGIYSYDITTSKLNNYSNGSHEICLKICVEPPRFTERYTHPRHLGTWQ